ncbi:hypothetical protein LZZ90_09805 [Flavobacterium sp. SM15]|uniref:hypothetical protein n=1 Tax=Flavobacterium sp. SM15 TaxID=2908005 RepID=UPI001EDC200F|nr:hypothetical protein [Flavobacterium sp. SM15]MCG2611797.1 hypothetical protein [Flavobacterium sp. SM15]
MERKTINSTAIIGLDKGFIQTPKNVITDANLTDSAVRLFQLILDTPSDKRVSLEYYRKMLDWSKNKLANATKSLQDNGYLRIIKEERGKGNGFSYKYLISSFGNLKSEADVKTIEELEEIIESPETNLVEETPAVVDEQIETPMNDEDYANYVGSLGSLLDYYGEDYVMEIKPLYDKRDVKGMEKVSTKYLKRFYNEEIAKVKNPESNGKAFKALQDWLKDEVFNKKNITELYSIHTSNINAKFLMYKDKYRINRPVDFETEMGDFLENPID